MHISRSTESKVNLLAAALLGNSLISCLRDLICSTLGLIRPAMLLHMLRPLIITRRFELTYTYTMLTASLPGTRETQEVLTAVQCGRMNHDYRSGAGGGSVGP